ncbi:MAG: ERCC4 domain-containing protein [Candidatus Bathyarchaeia archaeon]
MDEPIRVVVDSLEASAHDEVVSYLRLAGCEVEVRRLPVCDFVVSDRCGVERKDVDDFLGSLKDGRLFTQAKEMASTYERPILVLEGHLPRALKHTRVRSSSVYGALASLALDFGFSIIPTDNLDSTSMLIHRLAYREQVREKRPIQLREIKRRVPLQEQQIFLLSGIPKIGRTLAEELLNHFGTPLRVFEEFGRAEVETSKSGKTKRIIGPIGDVRGIGPSIVEGAKRLLTTPYDNPSLI